MNTRLLLCLSCALIANGLVEPPLFASTVPAEVYEDSRVGNIDVVAENLPPNASFDPKAVLNRLKTKVGDPFSQATFDSDLKTLSEEYDRIEPSLEMHNGDVYITLKVWPRPTIRSIKWQGNAHVKTKTLQKELGVKPNAVFNRQGFNKAFNKLKEYYVKKGYFESQLQYHVTSDSKTNEVDIAIHVDEGRSGKIENILFKGFSKEEESQLLEMIYTKKYNLFTSWFRGTGTYNEEALEQDRLTIINFLQNHGYADARVHIQVLESESEGKIVLEISADRGQVFHFGKITFKGNVIFSNEEVDSRFLVHPGEVYSPEKLRDTVQAIKDMCGRKGYINCDVQYETKLVEDAPVYNVSFTISEGEQYKIGMIHVLGNVQTEAHVILRESLLIPGETFDSAKLKATQMRLENIGYFKSVNVYAVRTQDDEALGENYRDVFIEVEETTTGNVSLFFGLSTADDLFGGLDLSESNFNYKGIPRIFKDGLSALRGGGEYAHARATLGARQRSYSISWMTPYFRDTLWRIGFEVTKSHSTLISEDYDVDTIGGSLNASYPLNPYWTFGTKYRIRNSTTHTSDLDREERREVDASGLISAANVSISFDNADSSVKPHNGFRSLLDAEFAGIGGDFTFLKCDYVNTYYTQLWRRGVMKYRWEFRFIEPLGQTHSIDDIPLSERFFLGGENTVRGYKPFDLGPRFSNGDPTGGISSNLLSIEYLQEIFSFLDAFLFADAGSISQKRFHIGHLNYSCGFGARVELINRVPVTVGLGFPINPDSKGQVRRFFFSMGGQF